MFHVTLQFLPPHGPYVRGEWEDGTVADEKFLSWVGTYGSHPTAVIQLSEERPGGPRQLLKTWTRRTGEVRGEASHQESPRSAPLAAWATPPGQGRRESRQRSEP